MGKLIPVIVGIAVVAAAAWFFFLRGDGSAAYAEALDAFVTEASSEEGITMGDDGDVLVTSASFADNVVTMEGVYSGDLSTTEDMGLHRIVIESQMMKYVCANEGLKAALVAGVDFVGPFTSPDGVEIGEVDLPIADFCPDPE